MAPLKFRQSTDMIRHPRMFNTRQFIDEQFKGRNGVCPMLRAYGVICPAQTVVDKWYYRESIPTDWFALLLVVLELDHGAPMSLSKYVRGM
jgi:hypothetical protein